MVDFQYRGIHFHLNDIHMGDIATWVGSVGTWLGSIGTLGAFAIALILFWQTVQDRKTSQAKLVAAWQYKMQPLGDFPTVTYHISNNSDEPAYDVILKLPCGVRGTFIRHLATLGPQEIREVTIFLPGSPRSYEYSPHLLFRDTAGKRWFRDGYGQLREIPASKIAEIVKEDPGAFPSIAEHPTLRKTPNAQPMEGIKIRR